VQARHLDAELAHERHVVLDHDHGAVAVDLLEQLGGLRGLDVGHAGDGLIDQQQLRLLRQQHADLEPLLLPMRERAGDAVADARQADDLEDAVDAARLLRRLVPEQRLARAPIGLERQADIVLDRVHVEHGRLLELAADAQQRDLRLVESREVVGAVEIDIAGVGPGLAGDDVHHGGLAGAVRSE